MVHTPTHGSASAAAGEAAWGEAEHGDHLPEPLPAAAASPAALEAAPPPGATGPAGLAPRLPLGPLATPPPLPLFLRLARRGEQAVTLFSLLLQLALYLRSAMELTLRQHVHQLLLAGFRGAAWAAATLLPTKAWLKWR